ncbi:hypothetical protein QQ008_04800 [Fulvivirgaceae bacterium BMA10]|uniref:Phosphatidic acid phosphatase type 2/haloperoxidase domain-containing protein n=1 Tax=Splendidivirga corallicola TaxID=3051826 RepID=A0ABT8KIX3_9BACT|nr:hypothetical protein [Fulvivirgaceae bacterium BMA10]
MTNNWAKIISYVLHPLMMPTILFFTLFYFVPESLKPLSSEAFLRLLSMIFIMTYILPLISVLLFRLTYVLQFFRIRRLQRERNISYDEAVIVVSEEDGYPELKNLLMENKMDRIKPFLVVSMMYAFYAYFFFKGGRFNDIFGFAFTGMSITIFLLTIITYFWKISAHSAAVSGVIGVILAVNLKYPENQLLYPLMILVILAGTIMSARLYLNVHRPDEVLAGALLGLFINFGLIYLFV